ncbi:lysophospholipid acyltransferase family protein [Luteibaculum oceani]|uniref:Lipid A biosynthesis acyltransferase n=1 Tax=Luteibaculum oceani TaxID=1294296 RepID=A0A5C6VAY1_9FLAO|nr:lipid A biosynthesis acyltransferase [Luteibaculum oceani]TXC82004.1 lipid A biosynthesis acyltransferase [Luteibaculum oceani]
MNWIIKVKVRAISQLPFWFWHGLSSLLYPVVYYLIGYRKKVVFKNLRKSFPEKNEKEIKSIAKQFYKHFCDVLLESIKLITVSTRQLEKRISFKNIDVLEKYASQGRHLIIVLGHYGNWEFLLGLPLANKILKHKIRFSGLYKTQSNKAVDDLLYKSRSKHGLKLIASENAKKSLAKPKSNCEAILFLGDQSPANAKRAHWTKFLNQDTGILMGTERYSKIFDRSVVYMVIHKKSRGYYEFQFHDLIDDPLNTGKGEISELHHRALEKDIVANPAYWLWTHKRWKRKKPKNHG